VTDDLELPMLEPPPGGLAKLRARLDGDDRKRVRWWWLAAPVVAAAIALVLVGRRSPAPMPVAQAQQSQMLADPAMGDTQFYWVAPTEDVSAPRATAPVFVDLSAVTIKP